MKNLHLSIIAIMILLLVPVMVNNQVKAICMSNPDWPSAPCYGCPGCTPSKEKQREEWNPYYQYKGASWMEMMKTQMIEAMKNGTLEDWVTGNQSNYDAWRYYYLNDQAPFFRSSVSGLNDEHPYFPPPLQQLKTGIAPKDVACKKGHTLVIESEDGSPACIQLEHVISLYLRGWIIRPVHGTVVFVIKPNTIGQIFVKYTNPLPDVDAELNTRLYNGSTGQEVHTTNLKVSVSPDTVKHTESLIATYNVAAQNTTGIYWLQVASCQFIPVTVAVDQSQIASSDLQFAMSGWRCPVPFLQFHVVNVSNMTAEYREEWKMKTLHILIILWVSSFSMLSSQAMLTPFFGHTLTQDFVNEQLHAHQGWIAVSSTNSSQDYVGPGQCSPFFNLNMRQGSLAYPHLNDIQLDLLTPTKIIENQTMPMQLRVTNNENYTLYNVTMLDWAANEFFDLGNLTEINVLGPHQSKIITGNITFATKNGITCFHYNGGQSKPALGYQVSAKNQTGETMESNYFNSKIAVKIVSPFRQVTSGISTNNVECNQGLQLMIRNEDNEPTCVTPESVNKLVDRGWGGLPLFGLPTSAPFIGNVTNSISSGNNTLPASFEPCDTPYPPNNDGFPISGKGIPLLYMPRNSIGKICVNYYDILHSGVVQLKMYNMTSLSSDATEITISASQNTISDGSGNATVVYTIKTGNYSGLYGWNVFCVPLPFAVGYDNVSKITRADLTWNPEGTYYCPAGFYNFNVIGLRGIGFKMIP